MTEKRLKLGSEGEELAAQHLVCNGYTILHRNYTLRSGEIDIIARAGRTLVFVEVKTRRNNHFGSPAAAVTPRKQRQISRVAQEFLVRNNLFDTAARFDVVSVLLPSSGPAEIEIITNAFELV